MPQTVSRVILALLAATAAQLGLWATFAPRSFYEDFPGGGRHWVSADGPYNEHLVRDVGGLYLALAVAGVLALLWREPHVTTLLGAAWTVFSVPHLAYHGHHLGDMDTIDAAGNVLTLGGTLVLALLLLVPARKEVTR
jgi:hypothetical protein